MQIDVEYPVVIGASLLATAAQGTSGYDSAERSAKRQRVHDEFALLRYDFWPASTGTSSPGVLTLGNDKKVAAYLPNTSTGDLDVKLAGKYEPSPSAGPDTPLDCVLLFDPATNAFRIECLAAQIHIKLKRDAPAFKPEAYLAQQAKQQSPVQPGRGSSLATSSARLPAPPGPASKRTIRALDDASRPPLPAAAHLTKHPHPASAGYSSKPGKATAKQKPKPHSSSPTRPQAVGPASSEAPSSRTAGAPATGRAPQPKAPPHSTSSSLVKAGSSKALSLAIKASAPPVARALVLRPSSAGHGMQGVSGSASVSVSGAMSGSGLTSLRHHSHSPPSTTTPLPPSAAASPPTSLPAPDALAVATDAGDVDEELMSALDKEWEDDDDDEDDDLGGGGEGDRPAALAPPAAAAGAVQALATGGGTAGVGVGAQAGSGGVWSTVGSAACAIAVATAAPGRPGGVIVARPPVAVVAAMDEDDDDEGYGGGDSDDEEQDYGIEIF